MTEDGGPGARPTSGPHVAAGGAAKGLPVQRRRSAALLLAIAASGLALSSAGAAAPEDEKVLDPAAMRAAALKAEQAKDPPAALDAWERIIDQCDSTEDQRTEARSHIHNLRPQVPRNQDPAAARPWKTLIIIFRHLDFSWTDGKGQARSISSTVTEEDERKIRASIAAFSDHVFRLSGGMLRIDAEFAVVDEPLSKLTPQGAAFWPAPWNIRETTDRLMAGRRFDSVFVYVKFKEGAGPAVPAPHMGGTFGGDVGPRGAGWTDVPWHASFPTDGEMELHEWLHQIDWMFSEVLFYPPEVVPSSDAGRHEGDMREGGDPEYARRKDEHNWMRFYEHIMSGHITRRMWREAAMHDPAPTVWTGRWLNRWLALGPLKAPGGKPGVETDYIGEAAARPRAGEQAAGLTWKALPPGTVRVDLAAALGMAANADAYLATYVYSSEARPARLLVGSDDGVKAWVNGQMVHSKDGGRMLRPDEDQVDVKLAAGWNLVLLKVHNIAGGWLAQARLTDPAGKTIWGLVQSAEPTSPRVP